MRDVILENLDAIEREHDVQIILAIESGSRAWGFPSADSDYDVRFVYVHRLDWYLSIDVGRDVIEIPVGPVLDINGWDLAAFDIRVFATADLNRDGEVGFQDFLRLSENFGRDDVGRTEGDLDGDGR